MGSLLVPTRDSFHFICLFQGIWILVLTGWIWSSVRIRIFGRFFSVRCRFQEQHLVLQDRDLAGFRGYRTGGSSGFVGGFSKGRIVDGDSSGLDGSSGSGGFLGDTGSDGVSQDRWLSIGSDWFLRGGGPLDFSGGSDLLSIQTR